MMIPGLRAVSDQPATGARRARLLILGLHRRRVGEGHIFLDFITNGQVKVTYSLTCAVFIHKDIGMYESGGVGGFDYFRRTMSVAFVYKLCKNTLHLNAV